MGKMPDPMQPWDFLQKAIPDTDLKSVSFGMPCIKSSSGDAVKQRQIEGVASTPAKDLQNETVLQKGMDLRYFLKHGYFNYDHQPGFSNKVGEPTSAVIKSVTDVYGKKCTGLYVKGFVWSKGHAKADEIWELASALERSQSKRQLGFSIQGKVLHRNGNQILKAWIQDIAITPSPVNTATWLTIVRDINKSVNTIRSVESFAKSLRIDDVSQGIVNWMPDSSEEAVFLAKSFTAAGAASGGVTTPESLERVPRSQIGGAPHDGEEDEAINNEITKSMLLSTMYFLQRDYPYDVAVRKAVQAVTRVFL